jgi:membrane protein DedA with SNARE-associated domain
MESLSAAVLEIVRTHAALALPIVFVLALGESLAFVSLLLPATVLLMGGGGIISAAGIGFWPIWAAAAVGAAIGDWISYWLGFHYKEAIGGMWPLSRHPTLLAKGHAFFEKWGAASVFVGRFFGPLRCVMPLVAGICAMPMVAFQFANLTSAVVWATAVLAPGWFFAAWLL